MKIIVFMLLLSLFGCTDAQNEQFEQYKVLGNSGHIKWYSGGHLIYEGVSTGKIETENQSNGWFFKEANTGKLIRVFGDCLIEN